MEFIKVTKENLGKEHICCAISNNKDIQVSSKKAWLADRFDDGLVFLKSVERGLRLRYGCFRGRVDTVIWMSAAPEIKCRIAVSENVQRFAFCGKDNDDGNCYASLRR